MAEDNNKPTINFFPKKMDLHSTRAKQRLEKVEKEINEVLDARKIDKEKLFAQFR